MPRHSQCLGLSPMAGFQVTLYGRFWVTAEDIRERILYAPCPSPEVETFSSNPLRCMTHASPHEPRVLLITVARRFQALPMPPRAMKSNKVQQALCNCLKPN